jgi:quinol monooxygenase YgiN
MLVLVAKLLIKEGREEEFARMVRPNVAKVREEKDCHAYIFHRSTDNPRMFMFYEQYTDMAALETHRAHLRELGMDLRSFVEGDIIREFYDLLE